MSKISVLKPNGQWSEAIYGLDKICLMKSAIHFEYTATHYWYDRVCNIDDYAKDYILCELEIDAQSVSARFMDDYPVEDNRIIWAFFKKDLAKAKIFKMRLSTLKEMAEYATYLKPVYDVLIELAEIPTPTPEGYCLSFKFENE